MVPYDPWRDLRENWPEIETVVVPMPGRLLGELRYPVIALRAGTSAAQRRCTLAHEIVHLERGVLDCGPWAALEELRVHSAAAARLVRLPDLARALAELGGDADVGGLAHALDVDRQTLQLRLARLTTGERRWLRVRLDAAHRWSA
jgi:hypothetical protein